MSIRDRLTDPARKMRTGVTAVIPRPDKDRPRPVWAGSNALNGNGEMTGIHWVNDAGYLLGPIPITNTCLFNTSPSPRD